MPIDLDSFTTPLDRIPGALQGIVEDVIHRPTDHDELVDLGSTSAERVSRFHMPEHVPFRWREYIVRDCRLVVGPKQSGLLQLSDGKFVREQFPTRLDRHMEHIARKRFPDALAAGELPEREPLGEVVVNFDSEWFNHYHLIVGTLPRLRHFRDRHGTAVPAVFPDITLDLPGHSAPVEYLDTLQRAFGIDPLHSHVLPAGVYPVEAAHLLLPDIGLIDLVNADTVKRIFDSVPTGSVEQASRDIFLARGNVRNRRPEDDGENALFDRLRKTLPALERVALGDLPIGQQMETIGQTRHLAGMHGAALTNMVFAPRGSLTVHEHGAADPSGVSYCPHFYKLAMSRGFSYRLVG